VDISQFLVSLLENLSSLDFIEKVDIQTEAFILKGRVILKKKRFLQIYFNGLTETTAFWIEARLLRNKVALDYLPEQLKDIYREIHSKSKG
jgi:hypothetical protein